MRVPNEPAFSRARISFFLLCGDVASFCALSTRVRTRRGVRIRAAHVDVFESRPATCTLSALRLEFRPIVLHLHPELCIPVFFLSVLPSFLGPHIVLLVAIYLEIEAAAAVVGKERDKEGARGVCSCHWNVRHKYDRGHRLAGRRGSGSEQLTDNWSRPPCRA